MLCVYQCRFTCQDSREVEVGKIGSKYKHPFRCETHGTPLVRRGFCPDKYMVDGAEFSGFDIRECPITGEKLKDDYYARKKIENDEVPLLTRKDIRKKVFKTFLKHPLKTTYFYLRLSLGHIAEDEKRAFIHTWNCDPELAVYREDYH